jgi:hypothetical protein
MPVLPLVGAGSLKPPVYVIKEYLGIVRCLFDIVAA